MALADTPLERLNKQSVYIFWETLYMRVGPDKGRAVLRRGNPDQFTPFSRLIHQNLLDDFLVGRALNLGPLTRGREEEMGKLINPGNQPAV
jgi:hypothetical protein